MKKRSLLSLLALLILLALSVSAGAEELPAEIRNALDGNRMEILKTAGWQNPGPAWFVLVRTPDGTNLLLCFEEADGRWVQRFHTAAAVPQGKTAVDYLYVSEQSQSFVYNKIWQGPILLISCDNGDFFAYERTAPGQWDLLSAFYLEEQVHVDFIDGEVKYRTPIDQNNNRIITVRVPLERDLRKVDITRIPKTPEAALKETEQEKE